MAQTQLCISTYIITFLKKSNQTLQKLESDDSHNASRPIYVKAPRFWRELFIRRKFYPTLVNREQVWILERFPPCQSCSWTYPACREYTVKYSPKMVQETLCEVYFGMPGYQCPAKRKIYGLSICVPFRKWIYYALTVFSRRKLFILWWLVQIYWF